MIDLTGKDGRISGLAIINRLLPVPYFLLFVALAAQSGEWLSLLSLGVAALFAHLALTAIDRRRQFRPDSTSTSRTMMLPRLITNFLVEATALVMLGATSPAWILVLPSVFASPFIWSRPRSIVFTSIHLSLVIGLFLYIGADFTSGLVFLAMAVGASIATHMLVQQIRMYSHELKQAAENVLEAEKEKSKSAMEAQQYRRLASMGQLAAGIAHEINNPLSYVISNLEFATRSLETVEGMDEDILQALADAEEGAERVRYIVRDIKTFSRAEKGQSRHMVDINDVVKSAINIMHSQMSQRAEIQTSYDDLPGVWGDKSAMGQVFVNLMANAAQAIDPSKNLDGIIRVSTKYENEEVLVCVSDTGSGIEDRILSKIFEPFFTSKPIGIGTGLGLSIVKKIVEQFEGVIGVESRAGEGTTFTVRFPAATKEEEASASGSYSESLRTMVRVNRVLIVDDDQNLAYGLSRQFNKCVAKIALSGSEALKILAEDQNFDVILCDLMMPAMTGPEFYEKVIKNRPELQNRFVFMTGGAFSPQVQAFLEQAWVRCLSKPFNWSELLRILMLPGTPEQVKERQMFMEAHGSSAHYLPNLNQ